MSAKLAIPSFSTEMRPCVVAQLLCRETPAERLGWAQQWREDDGKWTVLQLWHMEAGTRSSSSSSVRPSTPTPWTPFLPPSQPPPRCRHTRTHSSSVTIKAGKGTWQVEGAEVMASAQRRRLEVLKKRTVSQRGLGESRQSYTGTVWHLCVCGSKCSYAS